MQTSQPMENLITLPQQGEVQKGAEAETRQNFYV